MQAPSCCGAEFVPRELGPYDRRGKTQLQLAAFAASAVQDRGNAESGVNGNAQKLSTLLVHEGEHALFLFFVTETVK